MSSPSSDVILPTALLPAVRLAHGRSLWLLPAMVYCIQRGLRALIEALLTTHNEEGKGTVLPRGRPNPKIGLPYTYLMAWFALHCPVIIRPWEKPPEGVRWRTFIDSKVLVGTDLCGYGP